MPTPLKVPSVGESITEVQIGQWLKKPGEAAKKDEVLVEIETDKVTQELYAPADGVIQEILHDTGAEVPVGETIAQFEEGASGSSGEDTANVPAKEEPDTDGESGQERGQTDPAERGSDAKPTADQGSYQPSAIMPAAQRLIDENNLDSSNIKPTGPGNRLLKEDVQNYLKNNDSDGPASASMASNSKTSEPSSKDTSGGDRSEETVAMTSLRKRIAANLVEAQQTAALLTTFNEIDMTEVMSLRSQYKEQFEKTHGVKLGFMSFFVKASIDALKQSPAINAEVRGTDIVYKNYYDIGIAIGGGKGLVVPILRNAERMSFAEIEKQIGDYAAKAKANKLGLDDLTGGTFTITNGGIYGSLLSTPIVNPPQSGVLGMHGIVRRPIAVHPGTPNESIEVRPMMYVALTYDHRIVDGREAVTCLKRIKDTLEAPARMLMEV
jgi:2-oxoglutarate dehydrogenase E2 component (dihydrolipoamide succinyltransferase)